MTDFILARGKMISSQVRPNGITDGRIIQAMASLPRELFVPEARRSIAYVDEDIEIGAGRYLMEPMALAKLVHWLPKASRSGGKANQVIGAPELLIAS